MDNNNPPPNATAVARTRRTVLRRRCLWAGGVLIAALVLLATFAWLAGPPIMRSYVAGKIGETLGRRVEFGEVHINPLKLSLDVRDISVFEPDQKDKLVSIGGLYVETSLASLWRLAPVIDALQIERPVVRLVHLEGHRFNFSDIVDRLNAQPAKPDSGPVRFSVNNIQITQGQISFDDRPPGGLHVLSELDLALPFLSNLPYAANLYTEPRFKAKLDGAPLAIQGKTLPFAPTHQTSMQFDLEGLALAPYAGFLPAMFKFKLVSGLLDTRVRVEFEQKQAQQSVSISGSAALRSLRLDEGSGGPLLAWERLDLAFDKTEPLAARIRVHEIKLAAPQVWLKRDAAGLLNVQKMLELPASPDAPASATARVFEVDQFDLQGGKLSFQDAGFADARGQSAQVELRDLMVSLAGFSTGESAPASLKVNLRTAAGAVIGGDLQLALATSSLNGTLTVDALKPREFQAFYAGAFTGDLADTSVRAQVPFRLDWSKALQLSLVDASARLGNVQLLLPGQKKPSLAAREIGLEGLRLDLATRKLGLNALTLTGLKLDVARQTNGDLDLAGFVPPAKAAASPAAVPVSGVSAAKAVPAWSLALKKLAIAQGELAFSDASVAAKNNNKPALLAWRDLGVRLENLAYPFAEGTKASWPVVLEFSEGRGGSVKLAGTLLPQTRAGLLDIDIRNLELPSLQPYFAEFSNVTLSSGNLTLAGRASAELPTGQPARASYEGSLGLANVRALDKLTGEDFLRWRSLALPVVQGRFNMAPNPVEVNLGDIVLSDFFARLILNADGRLNLSDIRARGDQVAGDASPTSLTQATPAVAPAPLPAKPEGVAPMIRIGQIKLEKGNVNFSDFFIKPNYTTNLTGLNGSISKLASEDPAPADVLLEARIDNDAPVLVSGKLNPLAGVLFLDLAAQARGVELTRLTPYATKYAGYPIIKGKLSVDLKYRIEGGKLEASNRLVLDQLTFGEKVDSPDATKLPVLLAVALLKNSRGEIDVNLPISGSLSDPEFSIGGVVVRIIVNLLGKVLTAPFSLLAAAFGGSNEELSFLEFDAGTSELGPVQTKTLDTLAKALTDRSGLKLEIGGRIDPLADREGVRKAYVQRAVRAQKRREMIAQGAGAGPDEVQVKPEEYVWFLELAYKAEQMKKPTNAIGLTKAVPVQEMEKLLHDNAPVDDNMLKELADRRALRVKRYLEDVGKISEERLYLVAAKLTAEGVSGAGKLSRVDFMIRQ